MGHFEYCEIKLKKAKEFAIINRPLYFEVLIYTPEGGKVILQSECWNESDKEKGQRELRVTIAKLGLENWEIIKLETTVEMFSGNAEFVFGYFKRVNE